jgi:hypothetical protein
MTIHTKDSTIRRFNAIPWHDSMLVGISFSREGEQDLIRLSLEVLGDGGALIQNEVTFKDCAYVQAGIYLEAKRMCSDAISDAECFDSSDWKASISEPGPYDPVRGDRHLQAHLHFRVSLCPPGGAIDILAKDFSLSSPVPGLR